jgi:hypothetical protein
MIFSLASQKQGIGGGKNGRIVRRWNMRRIPNRGFPTKAQKLGDEYIGKRLLFSPKGKRALFFIDDIRRTDAAAKMHAEYIRTRDRQMESGSCQVHQALIQAGCIIFQIGGIIRGLQSKPAFRVCRLEQHDSRSNLFAWADIACTGRSVILLNMGFGLRVKKDVSGPDKEWNNLHPALADLKQVRACRFA